MSTGMSSERVSDVPSPRNFHYPSETPKLSCEASLNLRNGFSSKMNKNKRWPWSNTNTNTQIQIHKYKYKFAHTNTNTNTERAPESNFDILPKNKSFHENGHISGTVGPTSPQHHSNRSSWRARPEKHLRGSLTCPGNTGEPEAPVLQGAQTHRNGLTLGPKAKKWLWQKSGLLCSFWPDLTLSALWAVKKLHRDTLGKSLGGSVAEKRAVPPPKP